jgi:hypothetical protein
MSSYRGKSGNDRDLSREYRNHSAPSTIHPCEYKKGFLTDFPVRNVKKMGERV